MAERDEVRGAAFPEAARERNRTGRRVVLRFNHLPRGTSLNGREHWRRRAELNLEAADDTAVVINQQNPEIPEEPFARAALSLLFHLPDRRRRDLDNLVAGCKHYIDALSFWSIIEDDGCGCVASLLAHWERRPGEPGFTMTVEELE